MRITRNKLRAFLLCSASAAVLAAPLMLASATVANAVEFNQGEVEGSFDTTLSAGMTFRVQNRDAQNIGIANGGTAFSTNGDDGNLNYDRGITAAALKATHELDVTFRNFGAFTRFSYFYDFKNANGNTDRRDLTNAAIERVGRDFKLQDAFVYGDFDVAEHPVSLTVGQQVVSWGESTFIPNGLNTINPFDITAFRVPGAEVRDVLEAVPLVHLDVGVTDDLNVEGFYQLQWKQTEPDAAGTFFSTNDFVGRGGDNVMLGFGAVPDINREVLLGLSPAALTGLFGSGLGVVVPRGPDNDADHMGQYGLAAHYFAEGLNGTEFGAYFSNTHSRLPLISARSGTLADLAGVGAANFAAGSSYIVEYPEDIQTFGASFSTEVGSTGIALQGEYSFRKDQPLQIDDVEVLFAALAPAALADPSGANCLADPGGVACLTTLAVFNQNQIIARNGGITAADVPGMFGSNVQGYVELDVSQGQMTATQVFGPHFGTSQIVVVGEVGATYIHDMPSPDVLRLEGPGTGLSGNPIYAAAGLAPGTDRGGFGDSFAWGYRARARLDYLNVIGAVNLIPTFSFSHDVSGTVPSPLNTFIEDRMSFGAGLEISNLESILNTPWDNDTLSANVQYTNFFGGGDSNQLSDRDFISMNLKYTF